MNLLKIILHFKKFICKSSKFCENLKFFLDIYIFRIYIFEDCPTILYEDITP